MGSRAPGGLGGQKGCRARKCPNFVKIVVSWRPKSFGSVQLPRGVSITFALPGLTSR